MKAKTNHGLTALALMLAATTASGGTHHEDVRTDRQIQRCIVEIARHADYDGADRVVYWVDSLKQRNLAELEIHVRAAVYQREKSAALRNYEAFCVTGTPDELVSFRIAGAEADDPPPDASAAENVR